MMLVLTPMMLSFVSVGVFFKLYYEPTFGLLSWFVNLFTDEPFVLLSTPQGAIAGIVAADAHGRPRLARRHARHGHDARPALRPRDRLRPRAARGERRGALLNIW